MSEMDVVFASVAIGIGATAFMDAVAWFQRRFFGIPGLNYALVGRWVIGLSNGRVFHHTILQSPPRRYERAMGWSFHYCTGVGFVSLMLMLVGSDWPLAPTLWPPVLIGVLSLSAPFLIMQPAFGFGLAGSKTPSPWGARHRSVVAHLSFGVGVYGAGLIWAQVVAG